jgi:hypothetical protein
VVSSLALFATFDQTVDVEVLAESFGLEFGEVQGRADLLDAVTAT